MGSVRYQIRDENGQRIIDEIHRVVVYRFMMGDVEDPDLYAGQPIWDWQQTDAGKFVMKHALTQPSWERQVDHTTLGYRYIIIAELEKKKLSEFYLRWGKDGSGKIR